jgi:hypothetical protein
MRYLVKVAGLVAAAALLGSAQGALAQSNGVVKGSLHDLSTTGRAGATAIALEALPNGNAAGPNATEVCAFCHTPHGAGVLDAPLWNKVAATASFTMYDSVTMDAAQGPSTVGSASAACLSCHDGTGAVDVVINAPGTDGYDAAGASLYITGTAVTVDDFGNAAAALGGADLTNDHPIGIAYGGGLLTGGSGNTTSATEDPDFTAATGDVIGSTLQWWVDTGGAGRQKTDLILFNRATVTDQAYVECATCHDAHQGESSETFENPDGSIVSFMRVATAGSAICLACHTK